MNIANGIIEVFLNTNIDGKLTSNIAETVLTKAKESLGNLGNQFSFMMTFLPHSTILGASGNWKAHTCLNCYLSVHDNVWSLHLSIYIHKIGHNISLTHSHSEDGSSYGD